MVFRSIVFYNSLRKGFLAFLSLLLISCSTIESTMDETWDSITSAGDYLYDSIAIWEDDEPEQSEAVIIEEAVEVPEFAMPGLQYDARSQRRGCSTTNAASTARNDPSLCYCA